MWPKVSDWLHSPATTHVGHVGHAAHAVHSHGCAVPTAVVAAVHGALAPGVWGGNRQQVHSCLRPTRSILAPTPVLAGPPRKYRLPCPMLQSVSLQLRTRSQLSDVQPQHELCINPLPKPELYHCSGGTGRTQPPMTPSPICTVFKQSWSQAFGSRSDQSNASLRLAFLAPFRTVFHISPPQIPIAALNHSPRNSPTFTVPHF